MGGGRLTGKVGRFSVGALNMQTDDAPDANALATNFTVVRVKRDILRRSRIGAIFTRRSVSLDRNGENGRLRRRRLVRVPRQRDVQWLRTLTEITLLCAERPKPHKNGLRLDALGNLI